MAPSLPDRLGAGERGRDVARARLRLRRSRTRAATAVRTILALHTTISRPLGRLLFAVFYSPPLQSMIDRLDNPRITLLVGEYLIKYSKSGRRHPYPRETHTIRTGPASFLWNA